MYLVAMILSRVLLHYDRLSLIAFCASVVFLYGQKHATYISANEAHAAPDNDTPIKHMATPEGVAFGLHGAAAPHAPTLFVLCSCTVETAMADRFAALREVAGKGGLPLRHHRHPLPWRTNGERRTRGARRLESSRRT